MKERMKYINDPEEIYLCGVYKLIHERRPNVFYIGSTARIAYRKGNVGFHKRFNTHRSYLKRKLHHCNYLQNIINKYGLDGLWMEILEITTPEKAIEREQFYIDTLKPRLNTVKIAGNTTGYRHTEESKQLMSRQRKGRKVSEEAKAKISAAHKARENIDFSHMHSPEARIKAALSNKGRKPCKNLLDAICVPVNQFDFEGKPIGSYPSMQAASASTGIDRGSINNCALGNRTSAGGYLWSFSLSVEPLIDNRPFVFQKTFAGETINTFRSVQAAARSLGKNSATAIKWAIIGRCAHAYGYKWVKAPRLQWIKNWHARKISKPKKDRKIKVA